MSDRRQLVFPLDGVREFTLDVPLPISADDVGFMKECLEFCGDRLITPAVRMPWTPIQPPADDT